MSILDSFERRIVFPLMRLIAIVAIVGLLLAAVAAVVGAFIGPAGAADPPAKELVAEPAEIPKEPQGIMDRVSTVLIEVRERAPDVKDVAVAAKGYATGALEQFREGIVFGTLATVGWMLSVLFMAVAAALMGLFTLILVLLAIERNTRRCDG